MSKQYDMCMKIQEHIERNNLDVFKTRGALAMKCGFLITLIEDNEPDDPAKVEALRSAAAEVLGLQLD